MWSWLTEGEPWFSAKSYGIGSGPPIAWQGWVLLLSYLVAIIGLGMLAERTRGAAFAGVILVMVLVTAFLVAVSRARTEGGWRWRWGRDV